MNDHGKKTIEIEQPQSRKYLDAFTQKVRFLVLDACVLGLLKDRRNYDSLNLSDAPLDVSIFSEFRIKTAISLLSGSRSRADALFLCHL